ncbi:sugar transferase [Skermanella mucosa]|uniref:sugar transferase n=1 Tax=Skermanella mucosa TaxID=1789672 RepID=UPI001E569C2B|nr:sugar transferase [Skermanella mucosa]UEM18690.1 sugar transferase [Skermanella mucosa]
MLPNDCSFTLVDPVSMPSLDIPDRRLRRRQRAKRVFDLAFGALFLALLGPLFALVALAVATDGGPVLFRHQRIGRSGRPFACLKFRTMIVDADSVLHDHLDADPTAAEEWRRTQKLRNDPRVTRMGRFLREYSLDELPQLFNVLAGDMSLVGPRPITEAEVERYGKLTCMYFAVRPGMTGLWQVSGRSDISFAQRVNIDVRYLSTWSISGDLFLLMRTPLVVVLRKGAY